MVDVVVVSMHEKGFFCADLYRNCAGATADEIEGYTPDDFCTFKTGAPLSDVLHRVAERYPGCDVRIVEEEDETEPCDVCGLPVDVTADACPHCG